MLNALVSVIIPVYNVEPYLREAIDSVITQSYKNLEIILIDDGSTDCCGAICEEYALKDSRIRVIHQENKGLSTARNAGLDVITGNYVVFLDSDDAYHPEYVKLLIETQIKEDADIVVCGIKSFKNDKATSHIRPITESTKAPCSLNRIDALHSLIQGNLNVVVWNKLYKSKLWNNIRFPDGFVYEDTDTTYRIISNCEKISLVDQILYMNRVRDGSITKTNSWKNISDKIRACSHFDEFVRKNTPNIFTENELKLELQRSLNLFITTYARFNPQNKVESEDIRQKIITRGREISIKNFSLRTKAGYLMLCYCPILLRLTYPLYMRVKLTKLAIKGK